MINVIIPAYNCATTLGRALSSLVAQTDQDFVVTVIDDCSTEDIKSIVDDYSNKLNINYIRNGKNLGCGMSRQVGIDNTEQNFITFLDSDDMFMPYAVETFNEVIKANPNTEFLHTYIYQQIEVDGDSALVMRKDNFTACHGKLYNTELLKKFNIRNSPNVRWSDDSYFNSMCNAFMQMAIVKLPTMLWVNNKNSIVRKKDSERDALDKKDFLNAMEMSAQFIMKNNGNIKYLENTLTNYAKIEPRATEEDIQYANKILNYIRRKS